MGKLIRLELYNFKSYKGHHTLLFADSFFTSIIGPNGSGKSNSMDAISFVLGIKSSHLRSSNLRDLIYRGRILKTSKINADGTATAITDGNGTTNGDGPHSDDEGSRPSQGLRNDPTSAWVMAVYEDDTGDEQRWKRTITNGGQSEYRINDRQVNAKQYNDALEEEHILIKARNFLVFQGDVEAIASQSPKDLTRLIEQISGSLEFKAEYDRLLEESERANEDQLEKSNDRRALNTEIKHYQDQKQEADTFDRKKKEHEDAIITQVLWKLYHLQQQIDEAETEIQKYQDELREYRRTVEQSEAQLDDARRDQAKATRQVTKIERAIKTAEQEADDKRNELVPIEEKISISATSLERYKRRAEDVTKEKDEQSRNVDALQKQLNTVEKAETKWETEFKQAAQKQGRELSDADLQEYNKLKAEVNRQAANAQSKIDNLMRKSKTDEETLNSLLGSLETSEMQQRKLEKESDDLKQRHANAQTTVDETVKSIDSKKQHLNKLTSERLRTSQRHTELEEKLQEVLKKLHDAGDARRQSDRERRAKETLVNMKRMYKGVHGRVHELCKPKQKKYETAVSTALGRNFDSIVVDSEKTARDCMAYLRDQRLGQATFIPLDTIQVKDVSQSLKGIHKGMRLAIDTIDYDREDERAMSYACGNAMVCDDIGVAKFLCFEKGIEAKAVTLDGTVIHKGGLMTGGRGPHDRSGRKWEDKAVEELERLKDNLLHQLDQLPKHHQSQADESALSGELQGLEQYLSYYRDQVKSLQRNIDDKKKESAVVSKTLKELKPKVQQHQKEYDAIKKRLEQERKQVSQVEDQVYQAFCQRLNFDNIRTYEAQQGSLQQEGAQKKLEFGVQKSKLENQLKYETSRLQETKQRIKNLKETSRRDENLISSLEDEKETIQAQLDEFDSQLSELHTQLEAAKEVSRERSERVSRERDAHTKASREVDSALRDVSGLQADVQGRASERLGLLQKCKMEQIRIPLSSSSATLQSLPVTDAAAEAEADEMDIDEDPDTTTMQAPAIRDYGIHVDFSSLTSDQTSDGTRDAAKRIEATIAALALELETLSPNTRAVERLKEAERRRTASASAFESSRRRALQTREAFEDVRAQRADLFNAAFDHISKAIDGIYKALTRSAASPLGGQAFLNTVSADDDTPFDAGLMYHAMPPMKRFRDMDALSGGEKTIAALALLFAIHSFAPSPFFVLDEVDAALDNANVAKVARYIKEHARPGMQFIVISLKQSLFQESHTLVGVLRDQSANSSRTVTLDLRRYQPS